MLFLNLKTSTIIHLAAPLSSFIVNKYKLESGPFMRELMRLEEMRNAATSVNPKNIDSLEIVLGYVRQLSALPRRFPINCSSIKIAFAWMNTVPSSLEKDKPIAAFELVYEELCCLFNAAIIYWQCGIDEFRRDTQEGIKRALGYFQRAAGIFDFINGRLSTDAAKDSVPASSDLPSAQCLCKLMLAQGQECFYQNATKHEQPAVKNTTLARIAMGASSLYSECLRYANSSLFAFASAWKLHVEAKVGYWKALAEYHKALDLASKEQHGEALTRLNFAKGLVAKWLGEKKLHDLFRSELGDLQKLNLEDLATRTERENNLIYHCVVPDYQKDLSAVQPAVMTVVVPFDYGVKEEELLFKVLPTLEEYRLGEAAEQVKGARLQEFSAKMNLQKSAFERALEQYLPSLNGVALGLDVCNTNRVEESIESVSLSMSSVTLMRGEAERIIKEIEGFLEDDDPGKRAYKEQHKQLKKTLDSAHEADNNIKERFESLLKSVTSNAATNSFLVDASQVASAKARAASLKASYASLYEESIRRFREELFEKLASLLPEQEKLINTLRGLSLEIQKQSQQQPRNRKQNNFASLLSQMESDLGEGMTFYSGFQEAANKLLNNLRDFEASRALETLDIQSNNNNNNNKKDGDDKPPSTSSSKMGWNPSIPIRFER